MFNIEEKIKAWFKSNNLNSTTSDEEEKKKKQNSALTEDLGIEILTDDELKQKAENSVKEKYDIKETVLQQNLKLDEDKANLATLKEIDKVESKKQDVDNHYKNLNKDAVNNSIKQGISRSSIINEQIDDNNKNRELDFKSIDKEVEEVKKSNEEKLDFYKREYQNAINKLNLEEALEINNKFNDLKEKQDKAVEDAIKKKEEAQNKLDAEEKDKEENYQKLLDKYEDIKFREVDLEFVESLDEIEKTALRQQILNKALKYYYSFPPEQAMAKFKEDTELQLILGEYSKMLENYLKVYK